MNHFRTAQNACTDETIDTDQTEENRGHLMHPRMVLVTSAATRMDITVRTVAVHTWIRDIPMLI